MHLQDSTDSNNQQQSFSRDFKGIWIPREIWLHPQVLPLEKMVWAEIHSLYDRTKGGCFASNRYLANFFGVGETYISKLITKLKNLGLVSEVTFNGRIRVIRAILPPEDLSNHKSDMHYSATKTCTTVQPCHELQCNPPYIYNKEENKEEKHIRAPSARQKTHTPSSPKQPVTPYRSVQLKERMASHPMQKNFTESFKKPLVGVADEAHEALVKRHGEENVQKMYEYLAEWKLSKASVSPKDVNKHADYYRITKWVTKEVLENQSALPGSYKRTGKLAIESDKTAMSKLKETGTSYIDADEFGKQILEARERRKMELKEKGDV